MRVIAQPVERFFQLRPGRHKKRVDHDFAIGPVQHHNVSSRPGKQREIFRQRLRLDRGSTHLRPYGREMVGWSGCRLLPEARNAGAQKTYRKKLRQQRASRKPGGILQHFAPCALLLQKLGLIFVRLSNVDYVRLISYEAIAVPTRSRQQTQVDNRICMDQ
jgi:hypothetical protein